MQAGLRRRVQLIARHVVTHHVAAVVGEPELARLRVPVEPDGIPDAAREDLEPRAVRLHPHDRGVTRIVPLADVARSADGDIQQPVGSECDELLAVMGVLRERVVHDGRLRRRLELRLDLVEADDPVDLGDEERALAKRDAIRLVQSLRNGEHLIRLVVTVAIDDGVDHAAGSLVPGADEERALAAERHLSGHGHASGIDVDGEARRHLY